MKEYIVLTMIDDTIVFNYRTIDEEEKVFINKGKLYKNSLFYTLKFFKRHVKTIVEQIDKDKTVERYSTLKILRLITFKYVSTIIYRLKINNLVLDFSSTIDMKDYSMFLELSCIKDIYCYYMPEKVKNSFEKNGTHVHASCNDEVTNDFLIQQEVDSKDKLYYLDVIKITEDYPRLLKDLEDFLKINYSLKAIHVYVYSKELIDSIVNLVKNDESRNVVVFLHQGSDKGNFIVNNFEWLRDLSNKCKEDYTCEFRIVYANDFLKNNLFKQLTFNNLKLISILCVYVCVVSLIIVKAYEYIEEISVEQLNNQLISDSYASSYDEDEYEDDELPDSDMEMEEEMSKEEIQSKYTFENSFKALKRINDETVGYLVVKNTEISYPVVQHSDNNFYLKYDFYQKKSSMGWVYADYRNDFNKLDDNNIIYGHSMLNGTMFGTLKKVLNSSWRKDKNNMIISLDTENGSYKFEIFSAYKVDYTTDYLFTNFDNEEDKLEFIDLIRGRSSFNSSVDVGADDKILTLSTCAGGNNRRLVVHAVLLKEESGDES